MPPRRRIDATAGTAALDAWSADPDGAGREALATAVRYTLALLAERNPGTAVEVRVSPFGAVQCIAGVRHRRGTPPNVVETDPRTWLELATGRLSWAEAAAVTRVSASGRLADLAAVLPVL